MSFIFKKTFSGEQDFATITALEMVKLIGEHNIERFNHITHLWKCEKKGEEPLFCDFSEAVEKAGEGFKISLTNTWEFDIN